MLFSGQQKILFCLCSPHRMFRNAAGEMVLDTVSVKWQRARQSLHFPCNVNYFELFCDGLEIGEARTTIARTCLDHEPTPEFLFFMDDDVPPPADALVKLFMRARTHPDYDIYSGVYCLKRAAFPEPLIYGDNGCGPIWDWKVGDLLTTESHGVKSVGMGLTLIRTSVFQRLLDAGICTGDGTDMDGVPFFKTVTAEYTQKNGMTYHAEGTEDIWFCDLVAKLGGKILVDTSVLAGHVDKATGFVSGLPWDYGPAHRAKWMTRSGQKESMDQQEADRGGFKLALDLGAGDDRREWEGYRTYTTDLRKDTNPDYVMDSRLLNFPNDHWDLVASSHHLEHIPRWEQQQVWGEIFRVTKPGGSIEHIVPNIEWAARHIAAGNADSHVINVLYGAQESHGYERTLNLHYFGYTPVIAKALAEAVGFVDVEIEDYKTREELGYNLVIRGRKPQAEAEEDRKPAEINE